jgi:hypothetical protein
LAAHLVWSAQPGPALAEAEERSRRALAHAEAADDGLALGAALHARAVVLMTTPDVDGLLVVSERLRISEAPSWLELLGLLRLGDRAAFDRALAEFEASTALTLWYRKAFGHQFRSAWRSSKVT